MKRIDILYDFQHYMILDLAKRKAEEVSNKFIVDMNLETVHGYELIEKLAANPDYDLVVLHMGGERFDSAYRQADKCRKITDAKLVAESTMFPWGMREVMQHFDIYTDVIVKGDCLEDLLLEYGFIS